MIKQINDCAYTVCCDGQKWAEYRTRAEAELVIAKLPPGRRKAFEIVEQRR